MFLGGDHMTQPSGQRKSQSVNQSSTVDSTITLPDITSIIATTIPHGIRMMVIHQMLLILTKVSWPSIQDKWAFRLLFKISTSHWVEQYPHYQQVNMSTVPQSGKVRGQVTVAWIVKVFTVHSHHSELLLLSVETAFTPVKAIYSPWFQQHPRLPPAYIMKPSPQSSAGSFSGSLTTAEKSSLSNKGFHSRNTLEVQPSFRNSILNTVYPL